MKNPLKSYMCHMQGINFTWHWPFKKFCNNGSWQIVSYLKHPPNKKLCPAKFFGWLDFRAGWDSSHPQDACTSVKTSPITDLETETNWTLTEPCILRIANPVMWKYSGHLYTEPRKSYQQRAQWTTVQCSTKRANFQEGKLHFTRILRMFSHFEGSLTYITFSNHSTYFVI